MEQKRNEKVRRIVGLGLFTAIVIVLQFVGSSIRFGMFSISLVLVPIVVGAALYGRLAGVWLGFAFGMTVLLSGDAAAFLVVDPAGTVVTVLAKGMLAGLAAGLVYALLRGVNPYLAVFAAAAAAPIVNTGVFLAGCRLFFYDTITLWAEGAGFGGNAAAYLFLGLAGGNFLVELAVNMLLAPAILRILRAAKRQK